MSTTESGHARNTANFEQLVTMLASYGNNYSPSRPELSITGLLAMLQNSRQALDDVRNSFSAWKNATNAREIAFDPLGKFSSRLLNALIASGATKQTVNDLRTRVRKMQGVRAKPIIRRSEEEEQPASLVGENANASEEQQETTPRHRSVSQRSFDSRMDHFDSMIGLLSIEPLYAPNEQEFQVNTLQAQLVQLRTLNTAVINANAALFNHRIARNNILYNETDGMLALVRGAKAYVKAKFGQASPEFVQLSRLVFVRVVPKR
ncbi:MAG: hypothetical protein K0S33_1456 [Bacteroidetes bacterium]|jgi:hypothetical protein|nr:hypothetical protein [Bacteroidota bacterium]